MSRRPLTRAQAAASRAEKIQAAQGVLAGAVGDIRTGEDWQRFLGFQAKLHAYSANNVLLITLQHGRLYEDGTVTEPFPSYVASYRKWQALGRQVEHGQAGLAIIAPMRGTRREAVDGDGHTRPLRKGDGPALGEQETKTAYMRGFTVEKVFADTQTTGDPLPVPPTPKLLEGKAPRGLGEAIIRLIEERGYTVSTVPDKGLIGGANGITDWADKTVVVRADMDDAAMVKTLIHEAAHILLHDPDTNASGAALPRGHKEVEAESVAFVVARVHGMATDDYSFAYVAAWAGDDHDVVIANTAQRVAKVAKEIIAVSPAEHADGGRPAPVLQPPAPALAVEPVALGIGA